MTGVGSPTAVAVEAFGPDMVPFETGRDLATWSDLVPWPHSSAGKERLGRMTKAGQADIRRVLILLAQCRDGAGLGGAPLRRPTRWFGRSGRR
ncbi:IS110 family transposase [Paracoccus sp. EGI L200073]|nr:IS110 family transposase [Paracoccus salsus]MCF3974781.1 IS110 family transposase [Paracoccus salsus]